MTDSATDMLSSIAPEHGQLIEVRRRQWIVSDVDASAVSPELPKLNLVKLTSIYENVCTEVLKRLSALNRQRYEEDQAAAPASQGILAFVDALAPTNSKTKVAASARKASTGSTSK